MAILPGYLQLCFTGSSTFAVSIWDLDRAARRLTNAVSRNALLVRTQKAVFRTGHGNRGQDGWEPVVNE